MNRNLRTSLLLFAFLLSADSALSTEDDAASRPSVEQLDQWVGQLSHQRLTKRVEAKKELLKAGRSAIPALAKAALSDQREAINRSIEILAALAESEDEETADAARVTLQMLSDSEKPSTAERAKMVLRSRNAEGIQPFEGWDQPGNPFAGGGRNHNVSVSVINGIRTIRVHENGSMLFIQDQPGRGILVRQSGGKEPTQLVAKNLADLKNRMPEVAAIYEQYAAQNTGMAVGFGNGGGFQFGFGNMPNGINGGQNLLLNNGIGGGNQPQQMLLRQLRQLRERMKHNPAMQQMLDEQIQAVEGQ